VLKIQGSSLLLAQKVVQAVVLHYATTKPSNLPYLTPPASAAQIYIDPADGEAEQTSAMTAVVIKLKAIETR
jgi:hypothetical protein